MAIAMSFRPRRGGLYFQRAPRIAEERKAETIRNIADSHPILSVRTPVKHLPCTDIAEEVDEPGC